MEANISDREAGQLSEIVAERMGLHFPTSRWADLVRGTAAAANALGYETSADFARQLISTRPSKHQLEVLADHLVIGETFFFRDARCFEILSEHILPLLVRARQDGERRLRIWSSACCTGEEVYSIAITIRRLIPNLADWKVTLLATDISPRFLHKARTGIYSAWSFRDAPAWLREQYFHATKDGQFEILPEIKKMVQFAPLNLVEDAYPSLINEINTTDVIFCRNVLMYFTAPQAERVLSNLYRVQREGGWLVVGSSELLHASAAPYVQAGFPGAILYQKKDARSQRTMEPPFWLKTLPSAGTSMPVEDSTSIPPTVVEEIVGPARGSHLQTNTLHEPAILSESLVAGELLVPEDELGAMNSVMRSLANEGRLSEALACCDQLAAADKFNPSVHYLRAMLLHEMGNIEESLQPLRNALYLDPDFALAHFAMGNIARSRGRVPEANRSFNNALQSMRGHHSDELLAEGDGMTVGRLVEVITALMHAEKVL